MSKTSDEFRVHAVRRPRLPFLALCPLVALGSWLVWSVASYAVAVKLRVYSIPSGSMAPTLQSGDRVGVEMGTRARPERGEVWVFAMPPSATSVPADGVKRIVGLPGETVEVARGQLLINGQAIPEPYLATPMHYTMPARTLGRDEYFVLGDTRNGSHDSHVWGPLPGDRLLGRVKVRYWPPHRIRGL